MIDEKTYQRLTDATLRRIEDAFLEVDTEVVDCERAGDVLTFTFASGKRCVVNTQRPTRQVWLAANARGWHFRYDDATHAWVDEKGTGDELFATLKRVVHEHAGIDVALASDPVALP